ncbi:hypothetical protein HMPREF2799_10575 [Staphylococcus sp. HMSC057A02]|nr:hypothetical protein [Staphylococcus hominis]MCI2924572.1 hypothetical protein [Staphylococcus hominis]OFK79996.1 hypothetical protein HMPREF2799_10575 [Staphylococcus sp. HMSC057A02]
MTANILPAIFNDIGKLEKSQLKSLYLTVINRIDIRKDERHLLMTMNNWIKVAQISVTIISQAIIIMKEIQDEVK